MPWVRVDEHFYDHPKWHDAPGDSIALWLAATAWCNRNDSTTGFIPEAKTRGLVNVKRVANTLKDLCERDAFHRVPGGYQIHDYEEYQQPEKVKEIATKRAAAGRKGAAHRWEAARTAKEHAAAPLPQPEDDDPMANGIANAIAKTCPDTDTDTEALTKSSVLTVVPNRNSDDDDVRKVLDLIADARMKGRRIDNPRAYRHAVITEADQLDGALIRRMLKDGDGPATVALFVLGHGIATELDREETPSIPWCGPDCDTCDGTAWVDVGNGLAPCPERRTA
jgi:hypothetical protein